jgi:hypothetical protein
MIDARFAPIVAWPRALTKSRKSGQFRASYPATLDLLESELRHLRARNIVIQTAMRQEDLRNDGWPRAGARKPSMPGVIVSFESSQGPLSFACDRYFEWEDNLRAIALTLESLRAVERYGATPHREQYRGFAALPAPPAPSAGAVPPGAGHRAAEGDFATAEEAARFVAGHTPGAVTSSAILSDALARERALRLAAKKLHPDQGGDAAQFLRLQEAAALLREGED